MSLFTRDSLWKEKSSEKGSGATPFWLCQKSGTPPRLGFRAYMWCCASCVWASHADAANVHNSASLGRVCVLLCSFARGLHRRASRCEATISLLGICSKNTPFPPIRCPSKARIPCSTLWAPHECAQGAGAALAICTESHGSYVLHLIKLLSSSSMANGPPLLRNIPSISVRGCAVTTRTPPRPVR